ncbi:MAG: dienelactone hydrolase family protein [Spirosomataceae bacterium]
MKNNLFRSTFGLSTRLVVGVLTLVAVSISSCDQQKEILPPVNVPSPTPTPIPQFPIDEIILPPAQTARVIDVTFKNDKGLTLKGKLSYPALAQGEKVPAMVVLHGCGGLWKNDVPAQGMETQFNEWVDIFKTKKYITLFIDSYTPRTLTEFCDIAPPADAICSAAYERPRDAYAGLAFLRSLPNVIDNRIGLLGFSHGGSTAIATVVDAPAVAKTTWTVWYNDQTYTVPAPIDRPAEGGFKTAIAYYPGAGFYSYFGSIYDATKGKYLNYAPLLVLGASKDDLIAATKIFKDRALNSGSTTVEFVEYVGANHSFDIPLTNNTDNQNAKTQARNKVSQWLSAKL